MEFKRVYKGVVESVRQEYIDPFGNRHYEVYFRNGKKMYYQRSYKESMCIVPGNIIRFTANEQGPKLYWVIDEVLDSYTPNQLQELYYEEDKKKMLSEAETLHRSKLG